MSFSITSTLPHVRELTFVFYAIREISWVIKIAAKAKLILVQRNVDINLLLFVTWLTDILITFYKTSSHLATTTTETAETLEKL